MDLCLQWYKGLVATPFSYDSINYNWINFSIQEALQLMVHLLFEPEYLVHTGSDYTDSNKYGYYINTGDIVNYSNSDTNNNSQNDENTPSSSKLSASDDSSESGYLGGDELNEADKPYDSSDDEEVEQDDFNNMSSLDQTKVISKEHMQELSGHIRAGAQELSAHNTHISEVGTSLLNSNNLNSGDTNTVVDLINRSAGMT